MATHSKDPRIQLNNIGKALSEDLFNMPDSEFDALFEEDESYQKAGELALSAYQQAIQKVGAKKLKQARQEIDALQQNVVINAKIVDVKLARELLKKHPANDPSITLAARNLNEITDEEALEIVNDLIALGAIKQDDHSV